MNQIDRVVMTATAALLGLVSATAFATTKTFSPGGGSSGNWNVAGNWSPSGVPTEADDVVIPENKSCTVDIVTAVADRITLEADATVIIPVNCKLTLDNDSGNGSSIGLRAEIYLDAVPGGNASPPILAFIDQDHAVTGAGGIRGDHSSCAITIQDGIMLTSSLSTDGINGSLTILGYTGDMPNGAFTNHGLVEAHGSTLLLDDDTVLDDSSTALWKTRCGVAVLQFERESLGLEGDFEIVCATTLRCNASVKTCGDLINYNGAIDVNNGATFKYVGFSGLPGCSNPGGSGCGGTCATPCTVSADTSMCCTLCG